MPATDAYQGIGAKLAYLTGVSTWTYVGQLKTIKPTGQTVKTDDITNLDSPSAYEEILPTIIGAGTVDFTGVLPKDASTGGFSELSTLRDARTVTSWRIYEPDATLVSPETIAGYWEFEGFVEDLDFDIAFDKAVLFSGKLRRTGPTTYTAAA